MKLFSHIAILIAFGAMLSCKQGIIPAHESKMTIAFGSCNHQWDESQPIWKEVVKNDPDLWIWLGDIIYADTDDMAEMKEDYTTQKSHTDYKHLVAATDVIGIWDDHDYGVNDGGKNYNQKDESRDLLFDFLDIPKGSPDRKHTGAYQIYTYVNGDLITKVLLLDVRYFRDDISSEASILGEEQWSWLIKNLENSKADIHIIGGGIQFLPEDHKYEKWANFPKERARLIEVLDELNVSHPILLSGDRHLAEMSLINLGDEKKPLLEITSSGLTHSYRNFKSEENRHRIGQVIPTKNFGILQIRKKDGDLSFTAEIRNERDQLQFAVSSKKLPALLK